MLEALNEAGARHDSVQMIDFTNIRAYQHVAGALKGARIRVLAALAMTSRQSAPRSRLYDTIHANFIPAMSARQRRPDLSLRQAG